MQDAADAPFGGRSLVAFAEALNRAGSFDAAFDSSLEVIDSLFERPLATVCEFDQATGSVTVRARSSLAAERAEPVQSPSATVVERVVDRGTTSPNEHVAEATSSDRRELFHDEVIAPVGEFGVLRVGSMEADAFDEDDAAVLDDVASALDAALARIDREAALETERAFARTLFDESDVATLVRDATGRVVDVNEPAVELTGSTRDALVGSTLADVHDERTADAVQRHVDGVLAGGAETVEGTVRRDAVDVDVDLASRRVVVDGERYVRTTITERAASAADQTPSPRAGDAAEADADALRRLHELTLDPEGFGAPVDRLLSLGCDHFDLDVGILSRVDGPDYHVEAVVDPSETFEAGAVFDLGETMCDATLARDATEPLAFADVTETEYSTHPAADSVGAYVAAPVVVEGSVYGTVNFSTESPREDAIRAGEREFVKLVAQWVGTGIENRRRVEELERHKTVIEAVDDPVYALDSEGRFTFLNEAAQREFGYGDDSLGKHVSIGMAEPDVDRIRGQIQGLLESGDRSAVSQFELDTAEGSQKTVENRLALIGDGAFRGSAGVLRDVTEREERRRQLESFKRAIEEAADGVAILEDDEYVYVDDTHVEMYGFDSEAQLLGDTWQVLYDDDEVERLETEVFPVLESEGHWRGKVTGRRPDGSTFPAELSLTIVDDGRLVCTVRDETEREARERDLELKERAMDETNVSIQITDPTRDDNPLVYVNDGFEEVTGYTEAEALGRNPRFLQGAEADPAAVARLREAVDAEEPVTLELLNCRADGTEYWAKLSITPVYDDSGELANFIGIQQDVTERRRLVESLEDRSEQLELVLSGTGTGIAEWDLRTDAVTWDETLVETFGQDPETVDEFTEVVHPDDRERTHENLERMLETGEPWSGAFRVLTGDGETAWLDTRTVPVYEDGEPVKVLATGTDITERKQKERERRDRRRKFDFVLSNTDTSVAELDLETGAVQWDGYGDNDFGSPGTITAILDAVHPEDREPMQSNLDAMLRTGESARGEYRIENDDGEYVWIAARAVVLDDESASTTAVAMVTEITELKRREAALVESQDRYRTMLRAAPDPIFVADAETGEIVETNAAAEAVRGESRDEIIGRHQTELHPGDDPASYRRAFEQNVGETTMISELDDGTRPRLHTADGGSIPVEINVDTVELPDGPVVYGVFRDISERVERERELELKERAMNEANVGITISDPDEPDNPLVYVNDGFTEQTGYGREAVLGENCRFLQGDDRDQQALDTLRDAIGNEEPVTVELRNYRQDGEQFWNRLSVTPVYDDDGALVNYIGIQQDVTAEKTREQQLRTLHGTTREFLESDDRYGAATVAVETLCDELDVEKAGVYLRDGDELALETSLGWESERVPERVESGQSPLWEAFERDEPVTYDDVGDVDDGVDRGAVTTSAYFPLGGHGVVAVAVSDHDTFGENERRLIEVLAGNLTAVLDTLKNREELVKERERFQLMAGSVGEYAFLTVDEDGDVDTWNEGATNLFGYDAETAIGTSAARFHPASDRASALPDRLLQQARIAGESAHEGWRVRADGSEFYADVRYALLETDDGGFRGYAMIVRDMTDRRRQRRRTEQFVEESDDVVSVLGPDGTLTYVSGSVDRVLGYDPEDLVGENLFDYLHPDGREEAMAHFFGVLEGDADSAEAECRVRSGEDDWLSVEGQCRDMRHDDAIDGVLLYLRDVTDSKEQARRFEGIFNQTFQFTGLLEPDGTVIEANDAALEFGGFDREDVVGKRFDEAPWWTHSEETSDAIRSAVERAADGEFVRYETDARGVDGLATLDFSAKPVIDEDDEVSLVVVEGRDITERRQQRQQLEVMQRVMRHNMRNDLTKVEGYAQLLADESDPDARAEHADVVQSVIDRWKEMSASMSNVRKVLQDRDGRRPEQDAVTVVEDAVSAAGDAFPDVTVVTDTAGVGSARISADISEALEELVENASEAVARQDGRVDVALSRPDEDWVDIDVVDDGPGLPDMEAEVLETGEETQLNHGGSLGLWMVRTIVTQAGGEVSVETTPDSTSVTMRVPVAES